MKRPSPATGVAGRLALSLQTLVALLAWAGGTEAQPSPPGSREHDAGARDADEQREDARSTEEPADAARPPVDLDVRVFGVLDAAALPKAAPGFGAGGALQGGAWRGDAYGAYFPEQTELVDDRGHGAEVSLVLAAARFCWVPVRRRFDLATCLGGEAGVARARAIGVDEAHPDAGSVPWLAPQVALVGRLHLSAIVSTHAGLELAVPVVNERYDLDGVGDFDATPDLTVRLAMGFEIGP